MTSFPAPPSDRPGLFRTLNEAIAKAREQQAMVGLILADIKNFTSINRLYDFSQGDLLLHFLAQRLTESDTASNGVFRIGNDEFALVIPSLENSGQIILEANAALERLREPVPWAGREISLDVNLGCTAIPGARATAQRLVSSAEVLLQKAKRENRSICYGTESQTENDDSVWLLEQDLLRAIHNDELDMVFQPKIDLHSGTPAHAEALMRWRHPEQGYISPGFLVSMVTRLNREFDLSKWALHTALRRVRQWPDRWASSGVAVNIPANIVHHPDFRQLVEDCLYIWQVKPQQLTLEITENAIMEQRQASFKNLDYLKRSGVHISIDDFGTGYSSLEYFKSIPATELKIDQSFVLNMAANNNDRNIAQLIVQLAHRFGLKVVAEGVEHQEVLDELRLLGCDYAQGYFISHPLSHEKYCEWLEDYEPVVVA